MEHIERAMLEAKKHDCTVTRVRFPSPAPWIINDLRSSASKVQVNCPLKRLVPMRQVSLLNLVSGPIYGSLARVVSQFKKMSGTAPATRSNGNGPTGWPAADSCRPVHLLKSDGTSGLLSDPQQHALPFVKDRLAIRPASGSEFCHD